MKNKFEWLKSESDEAMEGLQKSIEDEGDDEMADDAANLLISVLLKALWSFRGSKEFQKIDNIEKEIVYEMIKQYEIALNYAVDGEDA
jgi:hypothetical protein